MDTKSQTLRVVYVPITSLHHAEYNPRVVDDRTKPPVRASIEKHGIQDPLLVNCAPKRKGVIIGGQVS